MQMIEDLPEKAKDEIKRADHLVYVTLKYTRTVDVIKNTIKRLMNAYEYVILECLEYAKDNKKIKEIPASSQDRVKLVKKLYKEDIVEYIKLYELLKEIDKAEYTGKEEYRKNVALIVNVHGKTILVDIPTLISYFNKTKEFIDLVNSWVE
ncbi:hypothetical protein HYX18_03860 [Candidatus Woesearchaeota archaeon]|nr:hypothetical protein [Candidatus Woesearchaeota archaeon]